MVQTWSLRVEEVSSASSSPAPARHRAKFCQFVSLRWVQCVFLKPGCPTIEALANLFPKNTNLSGRSFFQGVRDAQRPKGHFRRPRDPLFRTTQNQVPRASCQFTCRFLRMTSWIVCAKRRGRNILSFKDLGNPQQKVLLNGFKLLYSDIFYTNMFACLSQISPKMLEPFRWSQIRWRMRTCRCESIPMWWRNKTCPRLWWRLHGKMARGWHFFSNPWASSIWLKDVVIW